MRRRELMAENDPFAGLDFVAELSSFPASGKLYLNTAATINKAYVSDPTYNGTTTHPMDCDGAQMLCKSKLILDEGTYCTDYTSKYYPGKTTVNGVLLQPLTNTEGSTSLGGVKSIVKFPRINLAFGYKLFANCTSLESVNLKGVKTQPKTNLMACFYGCTSLKSIDISDFAVPDTLQELNAGWQTTYNATKTAAQSMFYNCTSLQHIKCSAEFKKWAIENSFAIRLPEAFLDPDYEGWETTDGKPNQIEHIMWLDYTVESMYNSSTQGYNYYYTLHAHVYPSSDTRPIKWSDSNRTEKDCYIGEKESVNTEIYTATIDAANGLPALSAKLYL